MPENADALFRNAVARHRQGDWQGAADGYANVLAITPHHGGALAMSGTLALQSGQPATALEILTVAAEVTPGDASVHYHLGLAAQQLGSNELAEPCYITAAELKPNFREALENLAVVQRDLGRSEAALDTCKRVLATHPDSEIALGNAGTLALNLGDDAAAMAFFDASLARFPFNANIRLKRSQVLLRDGRFAAAWEAYEWRLVAGDFLDTNRPVVAHYPFWDGREDAALHVVVTAEQGIGDEIMFLGCARDVLPAVGKVTWQVSDKLKALVARSIPDAAVVGRDAELDQCGATARVAAGSLPRYFRGSRDAFGSGAAYLRPDSDRVAHWQQWLAGLGAQRVTGIAWFGGLDPRAQAERSVELAALVDALTATNRLLVALQYGPAGADVDRLDDARRAAVVVPPGLDPWSDIDDLAALMVALGHIVTVDNAIAHLGGALGVGVDLLLPVAAERRWLRECTDSPWYSSLRLFRQSAEQPGDWRPVLDRLCETAPVLASPMPPVTVPSNKSLQAEPQRARVLLLNDTASSYHWGSTLTVNGLANALRQRKLGIDSVAFSDLAAPPDAATLAASPGILDKAVLADWLQANTVLADRAAAADAVVVNGEGTLHGTGHQAIGWLYALLAIAEIHGTPYAIINHSCYPPAAGSAPADAARELYRRVYAGAADVAVREPVSRAALADFGIESRLAFDCLPLVVAPARHKRCARVVVGGSAAADNTVADALTRVVTDANQAGFACEYLYGANGVPASDDHELGNALVARTGDALSVRYAPTDHEWLDAIGGASLLVSGRFHHSLAAAVLGTPFLVGASNTAKIAGLLAQLGAENAFVSWADLAAGQHELQYGQTGPTAPTVEPATISALKELSTANFHGLDAILSRADS